MAEKLTATYKIISEKAGNRYQFFCDLSGALCCTTKPIKMDNPQKELEVAWNNEGKSMFNQCRKCGNWISDVMFNPDALECVGCSPWEKIECDQHHKDNLNAFGFGPAEMEKYVVCDSCGLMTTTELNLSACPECGKELPKENLYQLYLKRHHRMKV